ncbi:hypothetical protein [Pinibacter aurantiacus]|uniref:Lipocalin-like domain-containing protein n=1 Tax=Pinibacter aurantiacus TaxID=2851599 RepID=A0A9E2S732_9BACT|nr:hypothetical protein [Pinibacter aurantiacus]MBV4357026.1 hypothetical protein [Pinibacter aurantiacus]
MNHKLLILLLTPLLISISCKKAIDRKKEQIVIAAVTNGRWVVTQFSNNGTDITTNFAGYEFQFYESGSVDAYWLMNKNTGTWSGDINALTITAHFQPANDTLQQLNEIWKITDSDWDYVRASGANGTKMLYLKKK